MRLDDFEPVVYKLGYIPYKLLITPQLIEIKAQSKTLNSYFGLVQNYVFYLKINQVLLEKRILLIKLLKN